MIWPVVWSYPRIPINFSQLYIGYGWSYVLECNIKFITPTPSKCRHTIKLIRNSKHILRQKNVLGYHQYHKQKFKVNIFTKKVLRVIQFCRFLHCCPFDDPRHHKAWPIVKYEIIYCLPICNKIRILHLYLWKYNFHFNSNSPSFFQERHLYQLGSNSNRLGSGVYHSQILLPYDLNSFAHRDFI